MVQAPPKELCVSATATKQAASQLRSELRAFLYGLDISVTHADDVIVAVDEAVANAVEHAYEGRAVGDVGLTVRFDGRSVHAEVTDRGEFTDRARQPNRGFGLHVIRSLASFVEVHRGRGTRVSMTFNYSGSRVKVKGLSPIGDAFGLLACEHGVQTAVMRLEEGEESGPYGNEHADSVQVLLVVDGELDATVDGNDAHMKAGDSVIIGRGVPHRFVGATKQVAVTFNLYVPPAY